MKKISPEKFLFELYIGRVGYSVYQVIDSHDKVKPGFKVLGYCEARRLPVRPRNEGFAIMVEDTQLPEENIFWLHVETLGSKTPTKPPAPSIKRKRAKVKDSYTMEEFNKAYVDFRMDKMGSRKEMEDLKGIMRAYRSLLHIYLNTEGMEKEEMVKVMMHGLQYEFGLRMQYAHGYDWVIKAADSV
jgi:hypothetical protein